jgi:capsular polysaccharide transport system permease protein
MLQMKHRWFILLVAFPTLLAAFYYSFVASDIYVSESRFVIKSPGNRPAQLSTLANLLQTSGLSTGQEQANEILDYVRSRSAVKELQRISDIRKAYSAPKADVFSRYPKVWWPDNNEMFYKYYSEVVNARFDQETNSVVLTVKAFDSKNAQQINRDLLKLSEDLVNRLNDRAQNTGVAEAERRRAEAETRMLRANAALTRYRNAQEIIDPVKQAVGKIELANRLTAEQAGLSAQLEVIQRSAPANPTIPTLERRIAALGEQIGHLNRQVVGGRNGIASKLGEYENLLVEQEFATQMLTAAEAGLAQSRSEMQKQQFYLELIVEPNLPDMPLLPNRLRQILVVAAALACAYMIGWMLIVGVLEHAPEN